MGNKIGAETPMMKQYASFKAKYPDAMLLFRVGDFYETYGEDAVTAAGILGIVLTRRSNGAAADVEMAGFPHHALDTYLPKLVRSGQKVAVCDQLEDPKLAKKLVKRGITELVTPGVTYNDNVLEQKENNFLASVHLGETLSGVAFLDISTGEFYLTQGTNDYVDKLLQGFNPSEVLVQRNKRKRFIDLFGGKYYLTVFDDWVFTEDYANETLNRHFHTVSLKGFGVDDFPDGIIAAGAAIHYLIETHHDKIDHIASLSRIDQGQYVWLDRFTIRNLELLHAPNMNARTLIDVMDRTVSPMGGRLMRRWIVLPLKNKELIAARHDVVSYFVQHHETINKFQESMRMVGDLERLIGKVSLAKVNPRELLQVSRALEQVEVLKQLCRECGDDSLKSFAEQFNSCVSIREKIKRELMPEAPALLSKGNVIAPGVDSELDELRNLSRSGKEYLLGIQRREMSATGIPSLKVGYNNVFGYYLEVTNSHKDKVPAEWIRKQTLTNAERYITEELKEYEQKILGAEEKIAMIEQRLYMELVAAVSEFVEPIQTDASLIARLDCLVCFSDHSLKYNYVRPDIDDGYVLDIKGGRHPVIEQMMSAGESYIANDVYLDRDRQQIIIITGPNMSGKSALLRQTALIVLMAQMGCYVPAASARIGLVDKVFTRVGASDNISSGESTFMVEMNETASILNNVSSRSLVLLDEIGRGTSTYDGISIAWAITEYLHNHPTSRAKVLFATHYHELNEMEASFDRIKNYHVTVKEVGNKVVFLRKLKKGGSAHSFGIHVAAMAGMPKKVIERAETLLTMLERSHTGNDVEKAAAVSSNDGMQLSFIQLDDPLLLQIKEDILNTNIDTLTPVEALMKLNEIKKLLNH
ncbi:DNA mismatch repair protein MutS [Bacteroides heparinolyticus]|uniref:DNA mismatch repair protein MutS n=1 Tax=Prevotella heparinolytica TaxID=28113 RepID=UPI0035A05B3C